MLLTDDGTDDPPMIELSTADGRVIVLFQDQNKLDRIARWVGDEILGPGGQIAAVSVDFPSFEDAVREFVQADPTLDVTFMTDSHPFVTQLVAELRRKGA